MDYIVLMKIVTLDIDILELCNMLGILFSIYFSNLRTGPKHLNCALVCLAALESPV